MFCFLGPVLIAFRFAEVTLIVMFGPLMGEHQ